VDLDARTPLSRRGVLGWEVSFFAVAVLDVVATPLEGGGPTLPTVGEGCELVTSIIVSRLGWLLWLLWLLSSAIGIARGRLLAATGFC
jgi:hypothetical protein